MAFHNVLNNASTTLGSAVAIGDLTITVVADVFPAVPFYLTLGANQVAYEIVEVTLKTDLVFTVTRAQDGTTAKSFLVGDMVQLFMVAGLVTELQGSLTDTMQYSTYRLTQDSNGIYTEVQHKRANATLILKSVLTGGISPSYTARTETQYGTDGVTVVATKVYTISYNTTGDPENEVLA